MTCGTIVTTGARLVEDIAILFDKECPMGLCYGTGVIARLVQDTDHGRWYEDGEEPCPHLDDEGDNDTDL